VANILILGGGFGGLAAAHELREAGGGQDEITLVAHDDSFFIGFAKLWDLVGIRALEGGTRSLRNLEEHGINYHQAEITAIDPGSRTVRTTEGEMSADALVVALGAVASPAHVGQLRGDAHDLYDAASLPAMRERLGDIDGGRVVVAIMGGPFKCPPAPYEATLLVDEYLRERGVRDEVDLVITTPQPITLPAAGEGASEFLAGRLHARDVEVRADSPLDSIDGEAGVARYTDGTELDFDLLLGVPPSVPPPVVAQGPLGGDSGWVEPDPRTLRTAWERVYAVGDCTHIPNAVGQLPKAGVFAEAEGKVAARNLLADLGRGEEATFDGRGYCFLELPGREVAVVEGDFLAEGGPQVTMTEPSEKHLFAKEEFERERLDAWLG
jgi:sulfide:quinone oxidoreductase